MASDPLNAHDSLRAKVTAIFADFAGERAERLSASRPGTAATNAVRAALEPDLGLERAKEVGFHLADWGLDAAFIVALHLCPERFTAEEIEAGVGLFSVTSPTMLLLPAALLGYSVEDIFGVLPAASPVPPNNVRQRTEAGGGAAADLHA